MQRGRLMGIAWLGLATVFASAPSAAQTPAIPLEAEDDSHVELGLHARSQQASSRTEQAAWVTLTLPLDRLASPRGLSTLRRADQTAEADLFQSFRATSALAETPVNRGATAQPSSSSPVPNAPPAPAPKAPFTVTFQQLRALSDVTRRAVGIALSVAGAASERGRLDSLSARARSSALLPELRLRALRNSDRALRWVPTTDDPYRVTQADGTGLVLEASATFRLDRAVFAREELVVERLRLSAGEQRERLAARVQDALLGVFRARELACAADSSEPARAAQLAKLLELQALLDALTAGWFMDEAPRLGRAVWGFPEAILGLCEAPEPLPAGSKPHSTIPVASLDESE